jgi:hypothetical protein
MQDQQAELHCANISASGEKIVLLRVFQDPEEIGIDATTRAASYAGGLNVANRFTCREAA